MYRFYCPEADFSQSPINILDHKEIYHIAHVLRLKPKQAVNLFNGREEEAEGTILSSSTNKIVVNINSFKKIIRDHPRFILASAIPKKGKFELIIEKATELGVDDILPLITARTEVELKGDRL